jgi:hypothetical protein
MMERIASSLRSGAIVFMEACVYVAVGTDETAQEFDIEITLQELVYP